MNTYLRELPWRIVAYIVSRRPVANYLIERAKRTPYINLAGYMDRDWLFNGYKQPGYNPKWPSVRVHHILRADLARHKHDHPWDARTIVLRNWYMERRLVDGVDRFFVRRRGDTAAINFNEYHSIDAMPSEGVWTLFITWKYHGTWGFLVGDQKIPHRAYLGEQ